MNERDWAFENLKAYLDGELSEADRTRVQQAVDADPSLAQELETMRTLSEQIRESARQVATAGYARTLNAVTRRPNWLTGPRLSLMGGAVGLLALVFWVSRLGGSEDAAYAPVRSAEQAKVPADAVASSPAYEGATGQAEAMRKSAGAQAMRTPLPPSARSNAEVGGNLGANSVAVPPRPASPPVAPQLREVIRTANVELRVKSVRQSVEVLSSFVGGIGGWVENSSSSEVDEGVAAANMTLRVPSNQFEATVAKAREQGEVQAEQMSGNDVTAAVTDLDARVRALKAEEETYIKLMGQARRVGEVMEVQQRIGQVRQELESLDAQSRQLKQMSAMSTISVSMTERPAVEPKKGDSTWAEDAWAGAWKQVSAFGRGLAQVGLWLGAWAVVWVPLAILLAFAWRRAGAKPKGD